MRSYWRDHRERGVALRQLHNSKIESSNLGQTQIKSVEGQPECLTGYQYSILNPGPSQDVVKHISIFISYRVTAFLAANQVALECTHHPLTSVTGEIHFISWSD